MPYHSEFIAAARCALHNKLPSRSTAGNESKPDTRSHVSDLTCCRGVFAAWVFAYHVRLQLAPLSFGWADPLICRGYLGVDGFFILSGLVLSHSHPALGLTRAELWRFWARRLCRIYPVHLAMLGLLCVLLLAASAIGVGPREPARFGPDEFLRQVLLLHGWGFGGRWAWNYPSWSISTEWAGYLGFPFLWLMLRRASIASCWAALGLALAGLIAADAWSGAVGLNLTLHGTLARFVPEFVGGMLAARLLAASERRVSGPLVAAGGLGLTVAATLFWRDWVVVAGLWLGLAGLMLIARQQRPPVFSRAPGLVPLGGLSYAFYMSFAIVETVQSVAWRNAGIAPAARPIAYAVTSTLLTFLLALAAARWVERPSLRLGRHLAGGSADR